MEPGALYASGMMTLNARFVHTNLIAQDWRELARFYEQIFGCEPVPPKRKLEGEWLEAATGVPGAQIQGIHLRLPGYGGQGPTLEVFQYNRQEDARETAVNRPGLGHIAFAVDDVEAAVDAVLAAGGRTVGEIVSREIEGAGMITFAYVTDPEGNVIELQRWLP
jgi:catechol 2,3-dioxygenase-like lactoylglutathione lyase family enzyme